METVEGSRDYYHAKGIGKKTLRPMAEESWQWSS
jgi:hypothetical protein